MTKATSAKQRSLCEQLLLTDSDLDHIVVDADSDIWGAWDQKKLVGAAGCYCETEGECQLSFCLVLPEYRCQGIQQRLIQARIAWAKRQGIKTIRTYANVHNRASIISLLKCGFTPRILGDWIDVELDLPESR